MDRENLASVLDDKDCFHPLDVESIDGDDIKRQVGKRLRNDDMELMVARTGGLNALDKSKPIAESCDADSAYEIPIAKTYEIKTGKEAKIENNCLLLEAIQMVSIWLQEHFGSQDIQYTVQGKKLSTEEVFGVRGLLVSLISAIDELPQEHENALSWYLVADGNALADVSLRLKGDPFNSESLMLMRDAIVQVANKMEITDKDGIKTRSVDETYERFYRLTQVGKIKSGYDLNAQYESADDYAKKMYKQHSYVIAERVYRQVFEIRKNILGDDHQLTLESECFVKYCELHQGKSDAAKLALQSGSESIHEPVVSVCDEMCFHERLKQETEKDNERKLASLKEITKPKRLPRIPAEVFTEIERIGKEQPNFAEVTELVLNTLHAQAISGRPAQLPPLLLSGQPGIGKTRYIKRISAVLGLPFVDIQLAGVTDGYRIAGLSRYWGTAGPGEVANVFVKHDVANPVFLLDEIDKAKSDERSDPLSVILLLLEKESSRTFKDAFVDVPLDVSHASFIATANDISQLPLPLISRFHCIDVKPLDYDGRCTMIRTTYGELLTQERLQGFLDQEISKETLEMLAHVESLGGRELKREILLAIHRACREHKLGQKTVQSLSLKPTHLRLPEIRVARPIGFVR